MYSALDFNNIIDLLNGVNVGNPVTINIPSWTFSVRPTFAGDNLLGRNTADVLKNKDLTDASNIFPTLISSAAFQGSPVSGHKFGGLTPDPDHLGEGILKGMTVQKTDPNAVILSPQDTLKTWAFQFTTIGSGHPVGFYTSSCIAYPDMNPRMRVTISLAAPNLNDRFYIGWLGQGTTPIAESNTPLDATTPGILLGLRAALDPTTWKVFSSAGTGTAMSVFDTHVDARNSTGYVRDFELKADINANRWTINPIHTGYSGDTATPNVPQAITTNVPLTGQRLYFHFAYHCVLQDTTRSTNIVGLEVEVGSYYGGKP